MSGSTWPPGSMRCGQRSLRWIVRPRAPELLVARHDLEGGSWRTASFLSAIHALTATRMARIGRGGQPAAGSHDPGCGGDRGRGSKTARIRLIIPPSTWLQFTVGSGSVVEVCRSYQVSTSDPSTPSARCQYGSEPVEVPGCARRRSPRCGCPPRPRRRPGIWYGRGRTPVPT